jgi:hypothetical protein
VLLVPRRGHRMDEAVLPEDYRRIMKVVRRAAAPVMVKQVCWEPQVPSEPARPEALPAKLNSWPSVGWLRKLANGRGQPGWTDKQPSQCPRRGWSCFAYAIS